MLLNLIFLGGKNLKYRIPLQSDDALDSLDDHLKMEGESRPYEVNK